MYNKGFVVNSSILCPL